MTLAALESGFFGILNDIVEPQLRKGWASPTVLPAGIVVLETRGRKSGKTYRSPLVAARIDDVLVVSTFRGGRSDWAKNLAAGPDTHLWLGGHRRRVKAVVLGPGYGGGDPDELPRSLYYLSKGLVPYTIAGWAFAILRPRGDSFSSEDG